MGGRAGAVLGNPESSDLSRKTTETLRHGVSTVLIQKIGNPDYGRSSFLPLQRAVRGRFLCQKPQSKRHKLWLPLEFPLNKGCEG
jgi:hypothetical protein